MKLIAPPRLFDQSCQEWIDRIDRDQVLLREELRLLERMNQHSGGHLIDAALPPTTDSLNREDSPDHSRFWGRRCGIPRATAAWAGKRMLSVAITAVDANPDILRVASESSRDWPEFKFEQHEIRALPYAAESFDVVLCSLALYHYISAKVVEILRRIHNLARVGYIVNDLRRNWLAIWVGEFLARPVISSIFRHDASQSCRAAFTVGELRLMAKESGLKNFRITKHHAFLKMMLEGRK